MLREESKGGGSFFLLVVAGNCAIRLFLQGKFDEAEEFIEERVKTRDKGGVPVFTHCHAVVLFAKAGISGAEEDRWLLTDWLG